MVLLSYATVQILCWSIRIHVWNVMKMFCLCDVTAATGWKYIQPEWICYVLGMSRVCSDIKIIHIFIYSVVLVSFFPIERKETTRHSNTNCEYLSRWIASKSKILFNKSLVETVKCWNQFFFSVSSIISNW